MSPRCNVISRSWFLWVPVYVSVEEGLVSPYVRSKSLPHCANVYIGLSLKFAVAHVISTIIRLDL